MLLSCLLLGRMIKACQLRLQGAEHAAQGGQRHLALVICAAQTHARQLA